MSSMHVAWVSPFFEFRLQKNLRDLSLDENRFSKCRISISFQKKLTGWAKTSKIGENPILTPRALISYPPWYRWFSPPKRIFFTNWVALRYGELNKNLSFHQLFCIADFEILIGAWQAIHMMQRRNRLVKISSRNALSIDLNGSWFL